MQDVYAERYKTMLAAAEKLKTEEIKKGIRKIYVPILAPPEVDEFIYEGKVFHFTKNPNSSIPEVHKSIDKPMIRSFAPQCNPDPLFRGCLKFAPEDRIACYDDYGHKPDYPENGKGNWIRLENPKFYIYSYSRRLQELWHIACSEVNTLKNP